MPFGRDFSISVSDEVIADMRDRLKRTRWPDQIVGSGWTYGADTSALRELCEYWADGYDWRKQEDRINAYDQEMVEVDGFNLHVLRRRRHGENVVPILMLHGWPSSFVQMLPLIEELGAAEERHGLTFDVVVASLPGYGFSDVPSESDMNMARAASLMVGLMSNLGHDRFALRASDVGAAIARQIALSYPETLIGLHLSGTNPFLPPRLPGDLDEEECQRRSKIRPRGGAIVGHSRRRHETAGRA